MADERNGAGRGARVWCEFVDELGRTAELTGEGPTIDAALDEAERRADPGWRLVAAVPLAANGVANRTR